MPDRFEKISPRGADIVASEGERFDPLAFLTRLWQEQGDIARFETRYGECFVFANPRDVGPVLRSEKIKRSTLLKMVLGEGLLASEGNYWRQQRRLMQPAFTPRRMAQYFPSILDETDRLIEHWKGMVESLEVIDVPGEMTRATLRIVCRILFSDDLTTATATRLVDALRICISTIGELSLTTFGAPFTFTPAANSRFLAGRRVIDEYCYERIDERRRTPVWPDDLLSVLLRAQGHAGRLEDRQIRDELATMFIAGHETTSVALAWLWKLLDENPCARIRLHEELDQLPLHRPLEITDIESLAWSRASFLEAMRLYPPVWATIRAVKEDETIAGVELPRGASVILCPWLIHRHPRYWPNPEHFDPQRFIAEADGTAHKNAYLPFGTGTHQCLGIHLARLEGVVILAQLAGRFRVTALANQVIRPVPWLALRQSPSMRAQVSARTRGRP